MASRTLLVDPTAEQKKAYMIANEALTLLMSSLKVGQPIKSAYTATKNFVMQKNADLNVPVNFGFGIGFNYKERQLQITATNETVVEPGMTFHVRLSISGISKEQARSTVAIGDTVIVMGDGQANQVLTSGIQKSYAEISYSLEESDAEEAAKAEKKEPKGSKVPHTDSTRKSAPKKGSSLEDGGDGSFDDEDDASVEEGSQEILKAGQTMEFRQSRLRSKAAEQQDKVNEVEDRKNNQMRLHKLKQRDLKIRFDKGEIQSTKAKKKVKKMDTIQAYKTSKDYPKDLQPGKIFVDVRRHAVLIPNS